MNWLRFKALCALVAISISSLAMAQEYKDIEFEEYELDNGLHVILHQDESAPVATTIVHYHVGSRDEDPKRTGFAHFFEHLMFEGTKQIPRASIDKMVQEVGGNLNAYTSLDETVYFFNVPANELQLALWIESQRMRQLVVNEIGVETQRGVVKEERRMRYDNSQYGTVWEKMSAELFKNTCYSWRPIGSAQHIDSASIPEFQAFYDTYYHPNNATLVVAGDFDEDEVREWIDSYFGQYERGPEPPKVVADIQPMKESYRETVRDPKIQLDAVFMGFRGPTMLEDDKYAAEMLCDILSNGESSRMYRSLVDEQKISVQAGIFPQLAQFAGLFGVYGIVADGKTPEELENAILAEFERVATQGVTEEELLKVRNINEAQFIGSKSSNQSKAGQLAQYHRYYGDAELINEEFEKYMSVTSADIQRVAKEYLAGQNHVTMYYLRGDGDANTPATEEE